MLKQQRIVYFVLLFLTITIGAVLEVYTLKNGPLMPESEQYGMYSYIMSYVCAFSVILAAYLAIRQRTWNPIVRMAVVHSAIILVMLDYFLFYETNMIFSIPVLAIAYIFAWPKD